MANFLGISAMVSVSVLCVEEMCLVLRSGFVSAVVVLHILWVSAFSSCFWCLYGCSCFYKFGIRISMCVDVSCG